MPKGLVQRVLKHQLWLHSVLFCLLSISPCCGHSQYHLVVHQWVWCWSTCKHVSVCACVLSVYVCVNVCASVMCMCVYMCATHHILYSILSLHWLSLWPTALNFHSIQYLYTVTCGSSYVIHTYVYRYCSQTWRPWDVPITISWSRNGISWPPKIPFQTDNWG